MVAIRAKGNNILKTSNEDISASQMPILCSIFLLQIFYWYFSSGPRGALWSIYKKFRVQGLINFWRVQWFIESVLILFFFEPDIISNLLQETKTFLRYFIFNNFNYKAFFKKKLSTFRQFFNCLENLNLLYFSLLEQTSVAPQPFATWRPTRGCWTRRARGRRGASWLRIWMTSMILTSMPPPPLTLFLTPVTRRTGSATQRDKPGQGSCWREVTFISFPLLPFLRFALYWRTTTLTYSSTSYTATSTLASLHCTPSMWTYNLCGKK